MTSPAGTDEFGLREVAILVLEAVGVLHSRGHQLLRIYPGMSGSGMYWRTSIGISGAQEPFRWTTGSEFDVAGCRVDASTTAEDLADRILRALKDPGLGRDWEYAGWYVELLGMIRRHRTVPIAYADYFDDSEGWEIGWGQAYGSRRRREAETPNDEVE